MSTPDNFYRWGNTEPFTADNFTKRFLDLTNRLKPLEALDISWQAALTDVRQRVLAQTETVISGLRDQLVAITKLQWLTATSGTAVRFVEGGSTSLVVDEASRALFAPGPFSIVGRISDPTSYAIVTTVAYDRDLSGQWDVNVVAVVGDLGAIHSDWAIGALAGSTLVQMVFLNEAKALQAGLRADAEAAAAAAEQTAADRVQTGQDRSAASGSALAASNAAGTANAAATRAENAAKVVDGTAFVKRDGSQGMTAKLPLSTPGAAGASVNLPVGTDPAAPAEGDVWNAGSGVLRGYLGGATHRFAFLGLDQAWNGQQTFNRPIRLTVGGTSASPADGDLRVTAAGLFARFGGAEQQMATAADVAAIARRPSGGGSAGGPLLMI